MPRSAGLVENCSSLVDGACNDLSRQMVYDVYLVDNSQSPLGESYYLDYAELNMEVKLVVSNPSTNPRSKINYPATTNCNKAAMMQWANEIFPGSQNGSVILSLYNNTTDCASDRLHMEYYSAGVGATPFRRAKLYEVIVDAYPGETINLECGVLNYNARESVFCPTANDPTGASIIACYPPIPYTVPMPSNTNSVANGFIQVIVDQGVTNPDGSVGFVVSLVNKDPSAPKTVNFFDFFATITFDQIMEQPTVVSSYLSETIAAGNNQTYRFTNENTLIELNPSGTAGAKVSIATIKVKGPVVTNLCWEANIALPQDNTARVRTLGSCTGQLNLSSSVAYGGKTNNCDIPCDGDDQTKVGLAITSEQEPLICGATINIGLTNLGLQTPGVKLENLALSVNFIATGEMELTSVSFGDYECNGSTCFSGFSPNSFQFGHTWPNGNFLNLDDNPVITLNFTGSGCVSAATVTYLSMKLFGLSSGCVPAIAVPDLSQACAPDINGKIWVFGMEPNPPVTDPPTPIGVPSLTSQLEDAIIKIIPENETPTCSIAACSETLVTPVSGKYGACVCPTCSTYIVTPSLNIDQRNGVDPWDLILISKHLLGLEPLNTPYKLIGADANKSGTVTTFDIVELRKLILGTYPVLPANTSWRFVDKEQVFTNPANPFADVIKESVTGVIPGTSDVDFIGVKIGDVDHSAIAYNRPAFQQDLPFSVGQETVTAKSEFITLPITYQGDQSLEAVQMGLHFDPTYLEFVAPSQGNIEGITPDCFGLQQVKQGNIALLWLYNPISNEHPLQAGDQLCYLTFKVLQPLPENGDWLQLGDQILSSTAWDSQGAIYRPVVPATIAERTASARLSSNKSIQVTAIPNPTHGAVQLQIDGGAGIERAKVGLFDAFGKVVLVRNLRIAPGQQTLDLPELVAQPAGVYNWRIWSETMQVSGIIVKQ
jgi:hypothetical protein